MYIDYTLCIQKLEVQCVLTSKEVIALHSFIQISARGILRSSYISDYIVLRTTLSRVAMKCINQLYRNCRNKWGKIDVSFLPVRQQTDGWNCGIYAVAFAAELLDGKSPADASFDVRRMRPHLFRCLEEKKLIPFPKVSSVQISEHYHFILDWIQILLCA